jgi:hypothetical protein
MSAWSENRKFVPSIQSSDPAHSPIHAHALEEVSLSSLNLLCMQYNQLMSRATPRPPCNAASATLLISSILSKWQSLSHMECADRAASSYPSTVDNRELFHLWDMVTSWSVVSPLSIAEACKPHVAMWKTAIRPTLLHIESCRLVFLTKNMEKASTSATAAHASYSPSHGGATLRMSDVLSQRALAFLSASDWSDMLPAQQEENTRVFPAQLITGSSGDALFDAIQADLILHGILPSGCASKYWASFLFSQCMSGSLATQICLVQAVTNCSHMLEYSTWPVAYTCSLIETVVAGAAKKEASQSLSDAMTAMRQQATEDMCRIKGVDKRSLLQLAAVNCLP